MIINVLGLRSLVSAGMLPVRKAFVKFSVKSLLPSEKAKAVPDIFTIPDEAGENPNIRTCLEIKVELPSDPFYTPSMTCTVFDKLYFDYMAQPVLGTFTLKLGKILAETRRADEKTVEKLLKMNQSIRAAIERRTEDGHLKIGDVIKEEVET